MRIIGICLIFFLLILSPITADVIYVGDDFDTADNKTSAKDVHLKLDGIDYFEAGFLTESYSGTGSPAISYDELPLAIDDDGRASGSIYIYWAYATNDKFHIDIGISDSLKTEDDQSSMEWTVTGEGISLGKDNLTDEVASFNADGGFSSAMEKGKLLTISTVDTVYGKSADAHYGTITLSIVADGGAGGSV